MDIVASGLIELPKDSGPPSPSFMLALSSGTFPLPNYKVAVGSHQGHGIAFLQVRR